MKNSKKLICLAVAASLVMGAALTGCSVINNRADVMQTVASVNISKSENFEKEFEGYASAVIEKTFLKREMITAYYNGYYQLAQQGKSNAEIFETIKEDLCTNAVMTQYATVSLLKDKGAAALTEYQALSSEAKKCEYILGGKDSEAVKRAKYALNTTLNSVLDGAERELLDEEEDDEYSGSGTRSTPTGIDATVEDYLAENYNVYTGYEGYLLENAGDEYEPLDGTTKVTRQKAYRAFVGNLEDNFLTVKEDEDVTDIWQLSYVQDSYVSQLQSEILNAFNDKAVEDKEEIIKEVEGGVYTFVQGEYESLLEVQKADYDTASAFETAMGGLSDSKFILYSPSTENDTEPQAGRYGTFGYVYNILLPFSAKQEAELKVYQDRRDKDIITESGYFRDRNKLLKNIVTTDQREAWFNGSTDYSFSVGEYNSEETTETPLEYFGADAGRDYLFFKNNVTDTEHKQYKALEKYTGLYSYNGTVKKNKNGSYTLIAKKLTIDDMLAEFSAYINYVLGGDKVEIHPGDTFDGVWNDTNENYYNVQSFTKGDDEKEIDYSLLVYATGRVNLSQTSKEDMLVTDKDKTTDRYKAMSAVNELQYAYTTDTGVLSQYIGYSVSAYDTSYIKEFEYAAQSAIREGVGTFKVCAGDYGWHLLYVTDTFSTAGGSVYSPSFTTERVETEGTFENRFYTWKKDSVLANEVTLKRNTVLKEYNTDKAVTVYKDAYKDLSGL